MRPFIKQALRAALRCFGYEVHKIPAAKLAATQHEPTATLDSLLDRAAISPIKLHFGCGPRILKGWINLDLSYEPFSNYLQYYDDKYYPPALRGSAFDLIMFDVTKTALPLHDNSVDIIFHEDFLEHLSQRGQVCFLAETFRVLKPGAIHRVNTPNLLVSMHEQSNFARGFDGVYVQEWDSHNHLNILTPLILEELAKMVGYSKVVFNGRNKSLSPLIPPEYRPDPNDRPEDGNLFADLIK